MRICICILFSSSVLLFCPVLFFSSCFEEFLVDELSGVEEDRVDKSGESEGRASLLLWNTSLDEALITIPSRQ